MFKASSKKRRSFSPRASKKDRSNFIGRIFYWLCLLAFVGALIYTLFFSSWTKIVEVKVLGTQYLERNAIQDMIFSKIEGKFLGLIEKNNYLLISEDRLEEEILKSVLKIQNIKVDKEFPNKLNISLKERELVLVFCRNEKCFIVNDDGVAFVQIGMDNLEQLGEQLLILQSDKGREIGLGYLILEKDFYQYLIGIKSQLENINIKIEKKISTSQLISGDLRIKTEEGWSIYFDRNVSLEKEIELLRILLENQLKDVSREKLDYIDLRSDKKIYYTFKDTAEKEKAADESQQP